MKHVLAAVLGLALAGCAPSIPLLVVKPGGASAREPRPASQVMNEDAIRPRPGTGAISVTTEERGWFDEACTFDVALDDQLVAGLRPGERVTLYAEPGRRVITLSVRDEASCTPVSNRVAMEIVEHTTQEILIGSNVRHSLRVEVDPFGRSLPP